MNKTLRALFFMLLGALLPNVASADNVAQIGSTNYESLEAAFAAVPANGKISVYEGTFELPNNVVIPEGVTIQGAGKDKTLIRITDVRGDHSGIKVTNPNFHLADLSINSAPGAVSNSSSGSLIAISATGALIENCDVADGAHTTLSISGSGTFTIKNSKVWNAGYGIRREGGSATIVVENCDVSGGPYAININGGTGGSLTVTGGTVSGWTSYSAGMESVTFSGVTFNEGSGQNMVQAYMGATFTDCVFNGTTVRGNSTSAAFDWSFDNCKFGEEALTEANATEKLGSIWEGTVMIDGERAEGGEVRVYDANGDYVKGYATSRLGTAVQAETSANGTVKLFADVNRTSTTNAVYLQIKQNLTLDLNGHNITLNGQANKTNDLYGVVVTGALIVNITDSSEGPYGTISNTTAIEGRNTTAIYTQNDDAVVNIKNINASGKDYGVWANKGTINISSGYIEGGTKAIAKDDAGNVEVSGGAFSSPVPEAYCADGFIPAPQNPETGLYTVVDDDYVAMIGTTGYTPLEAAIAAATAGQTVTLLADVNTTSQIEIGKQVTLDLNGKKIEYTGSATLPNGVILVLRGGDLTISDSSEGGAIKSGTNAYAAVALTKAGETSTAVAKLTVNGGTLEGYYYAITGNGSRHGTEITINDGTIKGTCEGDNTGIFHPQDGVLTINGGTITAYSAAVEMRAGTLNVTGGTLTATGDTYSYTPNGSGTTTVGAAIAIAQHSTLKALNTTLSGGTLSGTKTISVVDAQNNGLDDVAVVATQSFIENAEVPEGYTWKQNGANYYLEAEYVAQIGETKYGTLAAAFDAATDGATITLLANVNAISQIEVGKQITLDLNGKKIEYTGSATLPSGVILVLRGGDLTISDSGEGGAIKSGTHAYAAVALTKAGETSTAEAKLTVNGGTLEGYYYAISGNGSRHGTEITINGGTIKGTCEGDNTGIFHPQDGVLTINGGTITAYSAAVEMRAGTLNVTGGTLTATADTYSYTPNGSGTTTVGAAIAIAQHSTLKALNTTLSGGTLSGTKTISVVDAQNNGLTDVAVTATEEFVNNTETELPFGFEWKEGTNGNYIIAKATEITLEDRQAYTATADITGVTVNYVRELSDRMGKFQGWFVPFEYKIIGNEGIDFYDINTVAHSAVLGNTESVDKTKIWIHLNKMSTGDVMKANWPYIFKPTEDKESYTFTSLDATLKAKTTERVAYCSTLEEEYSFYGVYEPVTATAEAPFYYMSIYGMVSWGDDVTVNPLRWIMKVVEKDGSEQSLTQAAREVIFVENGQEASAIQSVESNAGIETYYTLDGVRVQQPAKGVYLKKSANGQTKKVFIK